MTTIDLRAAVIEQQIAWQNEVAARERAQEAADQLQALERAEKRDSLIRAYLGELFAQVQPELENERNNLFSFSFEGIVYRIRVHPQSAQLYAAQYGIGACEFHDMPSFIEALAVLHLEATAERDRQMQRAAEREAVLTTHRLCKSRVDAAIAAAPRWTWPAGISLQIYRWRWCIAPASDTGEAEYDEGFSVQSRIMHAGALCLEASSGVAGRMLTLPPSAMPIAQLLVVSTLEELPLALRASQMIAVAGIRHDYDHMDEDGDPVIVEDATASLPVQIGSQPFGWVRDALRTQLKATTNP